MPVSTRGSPAVTHVRGAAGITAPRGGVASETRATGCKDIPWPAALIDRGLSPTCGFPRVDSDRWARPCSRLASKTGLVKISRGLAVSKLLSQGGAGAPEQDGDPGIYALESSVTPCSHTALRFPSKLEAHLAVPQAAFLRASLLVPSSQPRLQPKQAPHTCHRPLSCLDCACPPGSGMASPSTSTAGNAVRSLRVVYGSAALIFDTPLTPNLCGLFPLNRTDPLESSHCR